MLNQVHYFQTRRLSFENCKGSTILGTLRTKKDMCQDVIDALKCPTKQLRPISWSPSLKLHRTDHMKMLSKPYEKVEKSKVRFMLHQIVQKIVPKLDNRKFRPDNLLDLEIGVLNSLHFGTS